jgi:hypothetical protein
LCQTTLNYFLLFFVFGGGGVAQELKTKSSEKLVVQEAFQIVKIFYGQ